jgi:hypothetical protein
MYTCNLQIYVYKNIYKHTDIYKDAITLWTSHVNISVNIINNNYEEVEAPVLVINKRFYSHNIFLLSLQNHEKKVITVIYHFKNHGISVFLVILEREKENVEKRKPFRYDWHNIDIDRH